MLPMRTVWRAPTTAVYCLHAAQDSPAPRGRTGVRPRSCAATQPRRRVVLVPLPYCSACWAVFLCLLHTIPRLLHAILAAKAPNHLIFPASCGHALHPSAHGSQTARWFSRIRRVVVLTAVLGGSFSIPVMSAVWCTLAPSGAARRSPAVLSMCAALALLPPRVNPGSLYRGGKGT